MTADPSKPELSTTGCLLRMAIGLFAVVTVVGCAAVGYFLWDQQKHRQALAAEVQAIREAGEPLDGADLNAFYRLPEGEADLTAEWAEALEPFTNSNTPLNRIIPYLTIDDHAQAPPHRPDTWPQLAAAEEQLAPYREALSKIAIVGRKSGGVRYPIDMQGNWRTDLPQARATRVAAYALQLQSLCHYHQGELQQATDDIISLIQMAQSLRHEPSYVTQLFRIAVLRFPIEQTTFFAADPAFPGAELRRIQDALELVEFDSIQLPIFLGERASGYQNYSQPQIVDPEHQRPVTKGEILLASRPGDAAAFLHWSSRAVEIARLPFHEALAAARDVEKQQSEAFGAREHLPGFMQNRVSQADLFSPVFFLNGLGRATTENRAFQTFCAIERYRRKEQRLPETLADLVPDYLVAVPVDPFTGQPLTFVKYDDHYVVYGFGTNGKDNQGSVEVPFRDSGVRSFYRPPVFDPNWLLPPDGEPPGTVSEPTEPPK